MKSLIILISLKQTILEVLANYQTIINISLYVVRFNQIINF